jgi:uncharacterized damage-inducible protein DinB
MLSAARSTHSQVSAHDEDLMARSTDASSARAADPVVITPKELLRHWQGHRALTRRVIDAFPEKDLFGFSVGGMRPFSELALEFLGMAVPAINGVATGTWTYAQMENKPTSKAEILRHRFQQVDLAFGQWENSGIGTLLYIIDNEIHHRGQGYVYLRALGIAPPAFYER